MADTTKTIQIIVDTKKSVKETDKLTKSLKTNEEQTKETKEETKKYDKQLEDTSEATGGMVASLDKMTGGLISSTKGILGSVRALKSFKIALAATGIGAVIIAITALVQSFRRTEEGGDRLNKIMRTVTSVFDNVLDVLGSMGTAIIDGLVNPLETAKKAWEGIKNFFTDPLGSIKRGFEAATEAAVNFGKEIAQDAKAAQELADLEAATNRLEREFLVERSKQDLVISRLRRKARQEDRFSAQERAEAQEEAIKLLDAQAEKEAEIAENRLKIIQINNSLAESDKAALDAEAAAAAEVINVQIRREDTARGLERILNQLRRQAVKEAEANKKANEEAADAALEWLDIKVESLDATSEFTKALEDQNAALNEQRDIQVEASEQASIAADEAATDQNKLNDALGVTTQAATGLLDVFQGKVQGKDIFKTVLKTLSGILSIVLPGSGAAIGGISSLLGGLFADGGYTKKGGKYEPAGIVHAGEWVANQELVNNPVTGPIIQALEEMRTGLKGYADGGFVASQTSQEAQIAQLAQTFQQQQIVLPIEDLRTVNTRVVTVEDRSTL